MQIEEGNVMSEAESWVVDIQGRQCVELSEPIRQKKVFLYRNYVLEINELCNHGKDSY